MIRIVCPNCSTPLKGPDDFAGKTARCPECKAVVAGPKAAAGVTEPPKSGDAHLLDTLLAEVQPGAEGEASSDAAPDKPVLRPKPKRSQTPTLVAVAVIVLVTLGGIVWAVSHITSNLALSNARRLADRVARNEPSLLDTLKTADEALERKEYKAARDAYESALSIGAGLMSDVESALKTIDIQSARKPLEEARERIGGYIERIQGALASDEIQKGAEGMVQFEGQWVTPEKRDELFQKKMADQGREYYEEFDNWLTEDEYHMAKGHVKYKDKWMTKAQYEQIKSQEEEKEKEAAERAARDTERRAEQQAEQARRQRERDQAAERAASRSPFPPDEARWVISDFEDEGDLKWRAQTWGNPASLSVAKHGGSNRLQVAVEMGTSDKAAVSRAIRLDLSDRGSIELDVENLSGNRVTLALAIDTSEFFESRQVAIKPGFNSGVKFRLDVGDFKAESTGWTHTSKPQNLQNTRRLHLLIYSGQEGVYYLDNIAAVKAD